MDGVDLPLGFRNALIVVAFLSAAAGLVVRETNPANRGLGMALVVVAACLFILAGAGRYLGWW